MKDSSPTRTGDPPTVNSPEATASPFAPTRWTLILRARGETPDARAALGEEAFATAWEEGQKMTLVQAVEYAIEGIQGD